MEKTQPIKPFETDGCSGGMSWLWRNVARRLPPWEAHCVEHDKAYWRGGNQEARQKADLKLAAGVMQSGYPIMSSLMYYAVRLCGHPKLPFSWRWAYGRNKKRGYQKDDALEPLPKKT
jgi:hypothetical protein